MKIVTDEFSPLSFKNKTTGKVDGASVEVVRELQKRLGIKSEIQLLPWARAYKISTTEVNVLLFAASKSKEREKVFTMVGPLAITSLNLYAKKDSKLVIETIDDAKEVKRIGVLRNGVGEQTMKKINFKNLENTTNHEQSAKKLLLNRVDLLCGHSITLPEIMKNAGGSINDIKPVFTLADSSVYLAFSKGTSPKIIKKWHKALESMHKDGSFRKIYKKWLPGSKIPEKSEIIWIRGTKFKDKELPPIVENLPQKDKKGK